jgi:transcription elongation factor S-II
MMMMMMMTIMSGLGSYQHACCRISGSCPRTSHPVHGHVRFCSFHVANAATGKATKAGVFVAKLRANPNKDIARAAAELVIKWKKLVEQEKASKLQKSKMGSPASAPASSPAPQAGTGGGARFTGDPEKRSYKAENVDIQRTSSSTRNNCIGLIYNGLAFRSTDSQGDIIAKSVAVEHAVFVAFKHEEGEGYRKKIRSLFSNLKTRSNKDLGKRVLTGDISPDKFATMTDEELKSEDQRKKEIELEKENMKKAQVPMAEKSISDSLECGRCKQKKVSYTQAQTRSADEPMTTFCECMNCGHRWKVCRLTWASAHLLWCLHSLLTLATVLLNGSFEQILECNNIKCQETRGRGRVGRFYFHLLFHIYIFRSWSHLEVLTVSEMTTQMGVTGIYTTSDIFYSLIR